MEVTNAINILEQATAAIQANRSDHQAIQAALACVQDFVKEHQDKPTKK